MLCKLSFRYTFIKQFINYYLYLNCLLMTTGMYVNDLSSVGLNISALPIKNIHLEHICETLLLSWQLKNDQCLF